MTNEEYIKSLERHGAKVLIDGTFLPLSVEVYSKACKAVKAEGVSVILYRLQLQEAPDENMLMAVWSDGHLDTGMAENIIACVNHRHLNEKDIIWRN